MFHSGCGAPSLTAVLPVSAGYDSALTTPAGYGGGLLGRDARWSATVLWGVYEGPKRKTQRGTQPAPVPARASESRPSPHQLGSTRHLGCVLVHELHIPKGDADLDLDSNLQRTGVVLGIQREGLGAEQLASQFTSVLGAGVEADDRISRAERTPGRSEDDSGRRQRARNAAASEAFMSSHR